MISPPTLLQTHHLDSSSSLLLVNHPSTIAIKGQGQLSCCHVLSLAHSCFCLQSQLYCDAQESCRACSPKTSGDSRLYCLPQMLRVSGWGTSFSCPYHFRVEVHSQFSSPHTLGDSLPAHSSLPLPCHQGQLHCTGHAGCTALSVPSLRNRARPAQLLGINIGPGGRSD